MPELDRDTVAAERAQQIDQIGALDLTVLEARRKLRQQRAQFAAFGERIDSAPELVEVRLVRAGQRGQQLVLLDGAGGRRPRTAGVCP